VALFQCLVPDRPMKGPGPTVVRIPAERELTLGPLLVRYSDPVADRAQVLLGLLPRVSAFVAKANGGRPPTEQFTVNILASGGGGWSGGQEIGVQCGGRVAANVAVIAHELTHMIEQLEAEHGADFMPRFLELCRALKGSEAPTLQEVLYHFSLVAGTDLAPAQRQLGTTVQRPPPIPPEELQRKLAAYRTRSGRKPW
jgi:hypothetical protein